MKGQSILHQLIKFTLVGCLMGIGFPAYAEIKILALGDSLTEGYGIEKSEAYPALVEIELHRRGYTEVTVINAGLSGSTSASGLSRLKWYRKIRPDILILALGANDGLRGLSPETMRDNLSQTIRFAQKEGIQVVLAGMRIPLNYGVGYIQSFEKVFPALAKKYEVRLIPFLLAEVGGVPKMNLPDKIHPNSQGHQMIAQTVVKHLIPLLKEISKSQE